MRELGMLSEEETETIRKEQADLLESSDKQGRSAESQRDDSFEERAAHFIESHKNSSYVSLLKNQLDHEIETLRSMGGDEKAILEVKHAREGLDHTSDASIDAIFSPTWTEKIPISHAVRFRPEDFRERRPFLDSAVQRAGGARELVEQISSALDAFSLKPSLLDSHSFAQEEQRGIIARAAEAHYTKTSEYPAGMIPADDEGNVCLADVDTFNRLVLNCLSDIAEGYPDGRADIIPVLHKVLTMLAHDDAEGHGGERFADTNLKGQFYEGLELSRRRSYDNVNEPVIAQAIVSLGKLPSEESIPFLREWMRDQSAVFVYPILHAIRKISPTRAAKEFLPELRSDSRYMRIAARYILQRLEFGRIGMSKGAVEYLDTHYQFEDEGREGDVAERLTPDGKIGVFKEGKLLGYFPIDFDAGGQMVSASLSAIQYHDLFLERTDLSPEEAHTRDDVAREYAERVLEHFEHPVFKDTNIALNNFTLQEQGWLLAHIKQTSPAEQAELADFAKRFEESGLKTFVTMEFGQARASHIMELSRTLEPERAAQLFERFASYVEVNRARIPDIQTRLQEVFPDLSVGESELEEAIVHRAAELIETVYAQTRETKDAGGQGEIVGQLLADFSRETDVESFLTSRLLKISEVFERENIDLRKFAGEQRALLEAIHDSSYRGIFARALAERTHLEPIPRVYWEVDRTSEDYSERFGFDVRGLLGTVRVPEGEKGVIVEFGPGSGMAKSERSPLIREKFVDVGVADRLYYPLNTTIENVVDFDALEKESGVSLSPEERARLADVIYKVLVIQPGQEADDSFEHSDKLLQKIAHDPEYLRTALAGIGERLAGVSIVPETRMQKDADGRIVHRDKIRDEEQSENWQRVKAAFAASPERFLRQESIYNAIPVHAPGIAFADFGDVSRLADNQIDVALAVRSTVYKTGEEYDVFLRSVASKMKRDGVWIDDSIRENGGAGYRLGAHLRFAADEREAGRHEETYVILGSGIAGEDGTREGAVPLSFLRTANNRATIFAREHLSPGFQMMEIEQVCSGEYDDWIRALDPGGKTLADLERARAEIRDRRRSTKVQTESESSEQFPRAA